MTPLAIEIALHYHTRGVDYPNFLYPAQQDILSSFLNNGYLTKSQLHEEMPANTMNYRPTEKLHFYCDTLCELPEPIQVWIIGA